MLITCITYLLTEYCNFGNKIKTIMKLKILRTVLLYLSIIIFSYSIYLKTGFSEGFGIFGIMLAASIIYLWIEYGDPCK